MGQRNPGSTPVPDASTDIRNQHAGSARCASLHVGIGAVLAQQPDRRTHARYAQGCASGRHLLSGCPHGRVHVVPDGRVQHGGRTEDRRTVQGR